MKKSSVCKFISFVLIIQIGIFALGVPTVFAANDQDKNFLSAKNITIGSEVNGEIKAPGDIGYFKFTTGKAGSYTVGTGGCTDTYGVLYDKDYKIVKNNDDGDSGSNNFSITQTLAANQTYYIAVKHYLESGTGLYTLRVTYSNILIQMFNENIDDSNSNISPLFRIFNIGKEVLNLSDVKIRYYYTADTESKQAFSCNSATVGKDNVSGEIVKMGSRSSEADYYLEISFGSEAGNLETGNYAELQMTITKSDKSNFTQIGDYSFNSSATDYTNWYKVTGYITGVLCWGEEPGKISAYEGTHYDYVEAGDIQNEKVHNLQTSVSTEGTVGKYSVRSTGEIPGAWFSYELKVPAGTDRISMDIREPYSEPCTREYNIYIDGVLLKHYSQTFSDTNIYNIKAKDLSSLTRDGKITVKFEAVNSSKNFGPSIADIWIRPI